MTTTTPTPIRKFLTSRYTNATAAKARIEQAYFPGGWATVTGQPFPSLSAIVQLRDLGATCIAIGYNRPIGIGGGRPRADFTIRECLS